MTGNIDLYLSDLSAATEVKMSKLPNGNYLAEGLPILKPGVWNGKLYTAADMQAAADAFAEIQRTDKWEPPLRPYHAYDREGKPVPHSAQETLGWHKALRWDEKAGLLRADFEIVDAQAAADLISGKLRFASTEVARGGAYTSPTTGKAYDTAIVGTAFVDNPAVKNMPWQVVLNAAEFGHEGDEGGEPVLPQADVETFAETTNAAGMKKALLPDSCFLIPQTRQLPYRDADPDSPLDEEGRYTRAGAINCGRVRAIAAALKGARGSNITADDLSPAAVRRLKAAASACGISSPVIEELFAETTTGTPGTEAGTSGEKGEKDMGFIETLKAWLKEREIPEDKLIGIDQLVAENPPEAKPAEPPAAPPPAPPQAPPVDDGLRQQVELHEQTIKVLQATIDKQAAEARRKDAKAQVEKWTREGKLPPAKQVVCYALLEHLMAAPAAEIEVLETQTTDAKPQTRKVTPVALLGELVEGLAPIQVGKGRGNVLTLETDDPAAQRKLTPEDHKRIAAMAGGGGA